MYGLFIACSCLKTKRAYLFRATSHYYSKSFDQRQFVMRMLFCFHIFIVMNVINLLVEILCLWIEFLFLSLWFGFSRWTH
jgi:hypothetical protein